MTNWFPYRFSSIKGFSQIFSIYDMVSKKSVKPKFSYGHARALLTFKK
jgi:hypothetical protein